MSGQGTGAGTLSEHTRQEIDRWLARFPPDRRQSAVIAALREAQHQNRGHLTVPLMDAVAGYIGLQPIQVYEQQPGRKPPPPPPPPPRSP